MNWNIFCPIQRWFPIRLAKSTGLDPRLPGMSRLFVVQKPSPYTMILIINNNIIIIFIVYNHRCNGYVRTAKMKGWGDSHVMLEWWWRQWWCWSFSIRQRVVGMLAKFDSHHQWYQRIRVSRIRSNRNWAMGRTWDQIYWIPLKGITPLIEVDSLAKWGSQSLLACLLCLKQSPQQEKDWF